MISHMVSCCAAVLPFLGAHLVGTDVLRAQVFDQQTLEILTWFWLIVWLGRRLAGMVAARASALRVLDSVHVCCSSAVNIYILSTCHD